MFSIHLENSVLIAMHKIRREMFFCVVKMFRTLFLSRCLCLCVPVRICCYIQYILYLYSIHVQIIFLILLLLLFLLYTVLRLCTIVILLLSVLYSNIHADFLIISCILCSPAYLNFTNLK